jgi:hypothetical protein
MPDRLDVTCGHKTNDQAIDIDLIHERSQQRAVDQSAKAIENRPVAVHHGWQRPAPGWRQEHETIERSRMRASASVAAWPAAMTACSAGVTVPVRKLRKSA